MPRSCLILWFSLTKINVLITQRCKVAERKSRSQIQWELVQHFYNESDRVRYCISYSEIWTVRFSPPRIFKSHCESKIKFVYIKFDLTKSSFYSVRHFSSYYGSHTLPFICNSVKVVMHTEMVLLIRCNI